MPERDRFASVADAPSWWLTAARVPGCLLDDADLPADDEGLVAADLHIRDGRIEAVASAGTAGEPRVDVSGAMVWPAFVDMHTHLDKGHIWPRRPNPDGTFAGALEAAHADRAASWTAADIRKRMEFALRGAYAHGTTAIRTHLDSNDGQFEVTWDVFDEVREAWRSRISLQAVSLIAIDDAADAEFLARLVGRVAESRGMLGAVTYMGPFLAEGLRRLFAAAGESGLDLDFHVDETLDHTARSLEMIARAISETGFAGRVVCGHCCSLSALEDGDAGRICDLVADSGIAVVSLPMCNLYLQDRTLERTPRRRGMTLIHELRARGVPVAVASDNTRDPFYAYGDLDPLEVFREAVRIGHLDHPIDRAPALVTRTPADIAGFDGHGRIGRGRAADLVVFDGRTYTELLARPEAHRVVLRDGVAIDRALPDYRELDDLMGGV